MTKMSAKLPKEFDDNGLESNTRHLLAAYPKQEYIPVVGLVRTKDYQNTEDFERVPRIEFVRIEIATENEAIAEALRTLLTQLHDARVGHVKQPLDLPDPEQPAPVAPLELEASTGIYSIRIEDEPKGKFTVVLIAPSGAEVTQRHALPRAEYGELEPDTYPLSAITGEILTLAQALIQDYESGFVTGDVVDAELVDDEETTTEKED